MNQWPDLAQALNWTAILSAVAVIITTLELLARRNLLDDLGLLSWEVSRSRYSFLTVGRFASVLERFQRYPVFVGLLCIRLPVVVAAMVPVIPSRLRGLLFLVTFALLVLWALRSPYGQDGADQMTALITLSLGLTFLVGTEGARIACAWFITLELCLSYFTAGAAKLASPVWRSGEALTIVFRTNLYGHSIIHNVMRSHSWIARATCLGVIALECTFPFVLIAPAALSVAGIACMLIFHLLTAVFMGLNLFLLAFTAAYPLLLFCRGTLGW